MAEPDQALMATEHCTNFKCDGARLVWRSGAQGWVCPRCDVSYGRDAKEGLADA